MPLTKRSTGATSFAAPDDALQSQATTWHQAVAEETNKTLHCHITAHENCPHPASMYPMEDISSFFLAAFISFWSTVSFVRLGL